MTTISVFSSKWRVWTKLLAAIPLILLLGGCAMMGSRSQEVGQSGSLFRTFSLMDEQGRKSGTLVVSPLGRMELWDASGNLVGRLVPDRGLTSPSAPVP
jgi:hypothetical protein